MVSNDEASRNVWLDATNGALKDMQSGAIAIESSTLTPAWVRVLAGAMSEAGGALLDAPVAEHSHVRRTADNVGIIAPNYNVAIR
jgi:3-hydroxyisobutyrate dehydrogenase